MPIGVYHRRLSDPVTRFWGYVQKTDTCWLWTGGKNNNGYGRFATGGRRSQVYAHRYAYELQVGPIPAGLHVLHRCDTPACVRGDHLFVGTHRDNVRDMTAKGRARNGTASANRAKTHCKYGHPFSPENTYISPKKKWRKCITCMRAQSAARRSARPEGAEVCTGCQHARDTAGVPAGVAA